MNTTRKKILVFLFSAALLMFIFAFTTPAKLRSGPIMAGGIFTSTAIALWVMHKKKQI